MKPRTAGERGSIPLVLLVTIVIGGLIIALYIDITTGRRLAVGDRDFNHAVQVADAGIQEAFLVLAGLEEEDRPPIGAWFEAQPREGTLERGEYAWSAMRIGANQWEVRSEGTVGEQVRVLEAHMGPLTLFGMAAFGDELLSFRGANSAQSYPVGNRGYVASNGTVRLVGNSIVDGVTLHGGANYDPANNHIRSDGEPSFAPEQDLPNIALEEYSEGGVCAGGPTDGNISDLLPLEQGRTYCVTQADFPGRTDHLLEPDPNPDPVTGPRPARIFIAVGGGLHVQGQGDNAATVNMTHPTEPDAQNLEIYLAGGSVQLNNHTKIAAGIYGPASSCSEASNAQAEIYGSIVCKDIINQGGWTFHYDERLSDVNIDHFSIRSLREEPGGTTSFTNAQEPG